MRTGFICKIAFLALIPLATAAAQEILPNTPGFTGFVGGSFSQSFDCSKCGRITSWSISGTIPTGLQFADGALYGTLAQAQDVTFTVSAHIYGEGGGWNVERTYRFQVYSTGIQPDNEGFVGFVGDAFSQTFQCPSCYSGAGLWTWSVQGTTPSGLQFNAGVLSGTLSEVQDVSFTVRVAMGGAAANYYYTRTYRFRVYQHIRWASANPVAAATAGVGVTRTITVDQPATWRITDNTLPGIAASASGDTVTISGIFPNVESQTNYSLHLWATCIASGETINSVYGITVFPAPAIPNKSLPGGQVAVAYSASLAVTGGINPYTWSAAGPLPPGLTLDAKTGTIAGSPTTAGTYPFTAKVTEANGAIATAQLSITIAPPTLTITTTSLAAATAGAPYSAALAAIGGTLPYSWSLDSGALPSGLSLGGGAISGTPSADSAGSYTFTVNVKDTAPSGGVSASASRSFTLLVNPPALTITTTALPDGMVGRAYVSSFHATGGTPPYSWSITEGEAPEGLSLSADGTLGGAPKHTGGGGFTVTVSDRAGQSASARFSVNVVQSLSLTSGCGAGVIGTAYAGKFTATGGTAPYTFALAGGTLPEGLSTTGAGAVSGMPKTAGTFSFTIRVDDSSTPSQSATETFTIVVAHPQLPPVSVTQVADTVTSGSQPAFGVSLGQAYALDLIGTASISFRALSGVADPDVVFANGKSTVAFAVPAGQTAATPLTGAPLAFQAGTTAGTITITIALSTGGTALLPNPAATRTITIPAAGPKLDSVRVTTTTSGFSVIVTGYSNTREVTTSSFTFTPKSGATLASAQFTVPVSSAFQTWYGSAAAASYGGQFVLTVPFTVSQGTISDLASVQVTLTNSAGSTTASGSFQ